MIAATIRQNLKVLISAYAKKSGLSESQISKQLYGNGSFTRAFFSGTQTITIIKVDEILRLLATKWPIEEWPPLKPLDMTQFPERNKRAVPRH